MVAEPTAPARVLERLDTLDGLAAGWLMRFGPNTRDAYARDLRGWLASCDEVDVDPNMVDVVTVEALYRYSAWMS